MSQQAGNWFLMAIVAGALAGCASDSKGPAVDPNIVPSNYREEVLDTLRQTLDDPTNVRDAFLSAPTLTMVGKDQRYTSCVRYNARDVNRQYTGSKDRIAYFYNGHLNQLVDATKEQCGNAAYMPFPELERLCLGKKCS